MEDRSKHIDDLFRDGLRDYREAPGAGVWTSLEQRLPAAAAVKQQPSKRWLWYLLLLMLLAAVGYYVIRKSSESATSKRQLNQTTQPGPGNSQADPMDTSSLLNTGSGAVATGSTGCQEQADNRTDADHHNTAGPNPGTEPGAAGRSTRAGLGKNTGTGEQTTGNDYLADSEAGSNTMAKNRNSTRNKARSTAADSDPRYNNEQSDIAGTGTPRNRNTAGTKAQPFQNNTPAAGMGAGRPPSTAAGGSSGRQRRTPAGSRNTVQPDNTTAPGSNTTGNTPYRGPVTGMNTPPALASNKAPGTNANRTKRSTTPTTDRLNEESYLRQPVIEEDAERTEAKGVGAKPNNRGTSSAAKDVAKENGLLYIPKEAHPELAVDKINAAREKNAENNTTGTLSTSPETTTGASAKETIQVNPASFDKEVITVTPASGSKTNLNVNPGTFRDKPAKNSGPASYSKKKKMTVQSEVADVSGKNTAVPLEDAAPLQALVTTAAPGKGLVVNETAEEPTAPGPTGSGGGGGGGGGSSVRDKNKNSFRFDGGIKAGFERGFASFTTNTFIFSPYLQWNVSPRFSFVLQPGFRYNQLNRTDIFDITKAYHRVTSSALDSNHVITTDTFQQTKIQRNYLYKSVYDSVLVGGSLKTRNFWEVELPLMVRYRLASNFAIFGGISLIFGNLIQTEETRNTYSNLERNATLSFPADSSISSAPPIPSPDAYFTYHTPELSTAPTFSNTPSTNPARMGLMFGFSYEFRNRVMIDVMYKQTVSDMRYIQNDQLRKMYTQPYLRIMLGLKLFESGREKAPSPVAP